MPIYEYECRQCRKRFEVIVQGASRPHCPTCGGRSLEKQPSVFATATRDSEPAGPAAPCGTCGDPRGAGSCSLD
jgi:putative FmdB family regulatory protein